LLVVSVVTCAFFAQSAAGALSPSETTLLGAMNQVRLTHGLAPLKEDATLEGTARAHTRWMLHSGEFTHGNFGYRILHSHARGHIFGENLAWGEGPASGAEAIVQAWLASPEHRANLLHPGYRLVGVGALQGCFDGRRHTLMVTTDFAGR
jgi:uncharacterized protein YkwD